MASVPHPRLPPRGPENELHLAAGLGYVEDVVELISKGTINIDQGDPDGYTPLMRASFLGHPHVTRILLNRGGSPSLACDDGCTALHYSAQQGHLAITKMLVEAGADLEAKTSAGHTPLHLAAKNSPVSMVSQDRQFEVMSVLMMAGANPNSRCVDGSTPLYIGAENGHREGVKMLLRGNANPLLTRSNPERGRTFVPLDAAAMEGHSEVVGELLQQCGVEGCGGASKGVQALEMAAINRYPDIMALLTDAGVVDNGIALISAIRFKSERSVRFLLQRKEGKPIGDQASYANFKGKRGLTPMLCALGVSSFPSSPRMVRLLVNAGVDTASVVITVETETGGARVTPLGLTNRMLCDKKIVRDGEELTEKQLVRLEGIRRLLLRVEAVRAGSWLWPVDTPSVLGTAAEGTSRTTVAASTPLRRMLPLLRRRARRPRVLLAALCRSRREDVIAREGADPPRERPDRARRPPPRTSKQSRTEEPSESEITFLWNPGAACDQPSAWTTLVQRCRLALYGVCVHEEEPSPSSNCFACSLVKSYCGGGMCENPCLLSTRGLCAYDVCFAGDFPCIRFGRACGVASKRISLFLAQRLRSCGGEKQSCRRSVRGFYFVLRTRESALRPCCFFRTACARAPCLHEKFASSPQLQLVGRFGVQRDGMGTSRVARTKVWRVVVSHCVLQLSLRVVAFTRSGAWVWVAA